MTRQMQKIIENTTDEYEKKNIARATRQPDYDRDSDVRESSGRCPKVDLEIERVRLGQIPK